VAARQQDSFLDKVRPRRPHRWQPPAYTVGLVEATLRLLLLLLPPHAVLQGVTLYQPKQEMISKVKTQLFLWLKFFVIESIVTNF
jgi:hypothetical protein